MGTFIVLEGPDGSGTTLHSCLLAEALHAAGRETLLTREPSDGPLGPAIREALKQGNLNPAALQLLFTADRADHVARVIEPAVAAGKIVITDRYVLSTIAYGRALGLEEKWLIDMNKYFIRPDVIILLLPPLSVARSRIHLRSGKDSLEDDTLQERVHAAYRALADADPSIFVFDTSPPPEEVLKQILKVVN